jgi:hypothetical protein
MSFPAEWLALREPYDASARNPAVRDAALAAVAPLTSISIVDLACGAGSTFRALSPFVRARQNWRLVDNDLGLLARASGIQAPSHVRIAAVPVDLARDLEAALDGAVDLVTTSALLDLVSEEWLRRLAAEIAARRLPFYAALSYDGRVTFEPSDPLDARIVQAVNAHQRRDKGFGPALGPTAAAAAITQFKALGYEVAQGTSDWIFGPLDQEIQREVLSGWATATREMDEVPLGEVVDWLTRRRDLVAAGTSSIRVGHIDFFARPGGSR